MYLAFLSWFFSARWLLFLIWCNQVFVLIYGLFVIGCKLPLIHSFAKYCNLINNWPCLFIIIERWLLFNENEQRASLLKSIDSWTIQLIHSLDVIKSITIHNKWHCLKANLQPAPVFNEFLKELRWIFVGLFYLDKSIIWVLVPFWWEQPIWPRLIYCGFLPRPKPPLNS